MREWKHFFKGKKITVMGLGLLGRGVGDAKFLAGEGAELVITDLKGDEALRVSLKELESFPNIRYRLGGHDVADFSAKGGSAFGRRGPDFILKAAGIPLDSPYVAEAKRNQIPVKMSASWFAEISEIPVIGITGTRGKSTVTHLLYGIMQASGMDVLLGGNIRGVSTLALLPHVKKDSIALMELDSWQCQGFGESGMSPNIAVFTTFYPDHMNYYKTMDAYLSEKAQIFLHQKPEDALVVSAQALPILKEKYGRKIVSKLIIADSLKFPKRWDIQVPGEHNKLNAMCAIEAARVLGIDEMVIKESVANFKGIPGRLEFLKEIRGVKVYNDNNATTPEATIAALRAVGNPDQRSVVLIVGGDDKKLDMSELVAEIPKWCSHVVLFKERGTDTIRDALHALEKNGISVFEEEGLEATVQKAFEIAKPGETILYSPAFSSFGKYFKNEFDRGDQFVMLVRQL